MYENKNKYIQDILKKLLTYGGKIIKKRLDSKYTNSSNNTNYKIEQKKLINVFCALLEEDMTPNEFKKNIINKKFPSKPSSKKITQSLYLFIVEPDNVKKIPRYIEIVTQIKNLKESSRFYKFKKHLEKKVKQLHSIKHKLKRTYTITLKDSKLSEIINQIESFNSYQTFDINLALNILKQPLEYISNYDILKDFFKNLTNKCNAFDIDNNKDNLDNTRTNLKKIISKMKVFYRVLTPKLEIKSCLKACKELRYLLKDYKEKFLYNEKVRTRNAYSIESFEKIVALHKSTIKIANNLLKRNHLKYKIPDNLLEEYTEMVQNKNAKLLNKKFWERQVNSVVSLVEKEILKASSKTMFGNKPLSSNRVLKKILKLFSKSSQPKIEKAFKNIDLTTASKEVVMDILNENLPQKEKFQNLDSYIKKIINHRTVKIKCDYKICYKKALDTDNTSWTKKESHIEIRGKGEKTVKAVLSSTPACDFDIFPDLKKGEGINAKNRNSEHAINLWQTEAKSEDGKVLFSGLRHANTRGKELSSKEIILAAAAQQYGIDNLKNSSADKVWEVKFGNVQLMSPVSKFMPISPDENMPFDQIKTFKELLSKGVFETDIKTDDGKSKKIKLKLSKPLFFNFGTNTQHYDLNFLIKSSYDQNKESMITLFGKDIIEKIENKKFSLKNKIDSKESLTSNGIPQNFGGQVGEALEKINGDIESLNSTNNAKENLSENYSVQELNLKKEKIINLSNQILYIWKVSKGKGKKTNPTAIQTRLALLLYLIGYSISFNCKSGKDRTGNVAAEINNLALSLEANDGNLPEPYAKITDSERAQLSKVLNATKADLIAEANTGYKGLKVSLKDSVKRSGKLTGASKYDKL